MHKVFEIGSVIWLCNFQFCESHFGKIAVKTTLLPSLTEEGAETAGWWASTVFVTAFEELGEGEPLFFFCLFFKSLSIFLHREDLIFDQFSPLKKPKQNNKTLAFGLYSNNCCEVNVKVIYNPKIAPNF